MKLAIFIYHVYFTNGDFHDQDSVFSEGILHLGHHRAL